MEQTTASARLSDYFVKPLGSCTIQQGYFLEIAHRLMGTFPAIYSDSKKIILCLEKGILEDVYFHLDPRVYKVSEILLLVDQEKGVGFSLRAGQQGDDAEALPILTRASYEVLVRENEKPFRWAPGII